MISIVAQLVGFVAWVLVVDTAARWGLARKGKFLAFVSAAAAGLIRSVVADFTLAYAVPGWDRPFEDVVARAIVSAVFAMIYNIVFVRRRKSEVSN